MEKTIFKVLVENALESLKELSLYNYLIEAAEADTSGITLLRILGKLPESPIKVGTIVRRIDAPQKIAAISRINKDGDASSEKYEYDDYAWYPAGTTEEEALEGKNSRSHKLLDDYVKLKTGRKIKDSHYFNIYSNWEKHYEIVEQD